MSREARLSALAVELKDFMHAHCLGDVLDVLAATCREETAELRSRYGADDDDAAEFDRIAVALETLAVTGV